MDKSELAFVRRRRNWAGFDRVATVCCLTTVHSTLVMGKKSGVADMGGKVRRTEGAANIRRGKTNNGRTVP